MNNQLTKIVIACGMAFALSACSSQKMMKAQDSLVAADVSQISSSSNIQKVNAKDAFITERKMSSDKTLNKKADDDVTVNAMVAALADDLKQSKIIAASDYQKDLQNIKTQYDKDIADVDYSEYEETKHSINIGILKSQTEIDSLKEADGNKCHPAKDHNDSAPTKGLLADSGAGNDQLCDDDDDHLLSLRNDLERFKLELNRIDAREKLFGYQEELKIEKKSIRARINANRAYETIIAKLDVDNKVKTLLVKRTHDADKKFSSSIASSSDLVDMYDKQLDKLADYSDDDEF